MHAALSSVRSHALETVARLSRPSSRTASLPTTSSAWSTDAPKTSFDRPRLRLSLRTASDDAETSTARATRSRLLFLLGCLAWYTSSSVSSNTSKALLSKTHHHHHRHGQHEASPPSPPSPPAFPYPVTLTLVHFAFVNVCCAACASQRLLGRRALTRLVKPSWSRVAEVAQLAFFNVLGQALSSLAISRVPVATVHTIKALSPLFTVLSYSLLFNVSYSAHTYLSLLPLTAGVMMACTGFAFNADDLVGFAAALASTFVFVAQNIYSKKLLRQQRQPAQLERMDKLNILFYSSACSILLLLPLAIFYDGSAILNRPSWRASSEFPNGRGGVVLGLLLVNGLVHFAQNVLAFNVLAMVSPVTYSIASLLKRVFVIVLAILWFGQTVSWLQTCGIALTFCGLWMYNDSKSRRDAETAEQKAQRKHDPAAHILPLTNATPRTTTNATTPGIVSMGAKGGMGLYARHAEPPRYVPSRVGGWNDVPPAAALGRSYMLDPTKSLPSPPDSDKET